MKTEQELLSLISSLKSTVAELQDTISAIAKRENKSQVVLLDNSFDPDPESRSYNDTDAGPVSTLIVVVGFILGVIGMSLLLRG